MMLPINWDKINSFVDSNDLFNRTARSMENCLCTYFQDDEESFLEDFRADWETVRNTYRFENAGISFSRDFWRELDYISVWIRIYDAEDSYIGEYNLFFDEQLNVIDDTLRR